jgi:hypothetical protein
MTRLQCFIHWPHERESTLVSLARMTPFPWQGLSILALMARNFASGLRCLLFGRSDPGRQRAAHENAVVAEEFID